MVTISSNRLDKNTYIGEKRHLFIENKICTGTFSLHSHEYFEIEIVVGGSGVQRLNGKEYRLEKGSISILTPADFHEVIIDGKLEVWNISFDENILNTSRLESMFSSVNKSGAVLTDNTFKRLIRIISLMNVEQDEKENILPLFDYFLSVVLGESGNSETLSPIKRAILYIETHFRESPSLETVAKHVCLSPVYFSNLFKKETGDNYIDYLNHKKINYAMMLLKNGVSVTEVCFTSGFGSLSGFLYTFKKKNGISPAEYKNRNN